MKIKRNLFIMGLLLIAMFMASPVMAQDDGIQEISFEDDNLEGDVLTPDGSNMRVLGDEELDSLIQVREEFVDEMIKSVEDL